MNKKESEIRVFDGSKFPVWKFYMMLCFNTKKVIGHVNGTIPKPAENAPELEKMTWLDNGNLAKQLIGESVSVPILENLVNCETAADMWSTLCSLYQQKSREHIYMVQNKFYEYKMSIGDSINVHVNKVISLGNLLKDLGKEVDDDMLITKIICSLPPSYNSIVTAWANVPDDEQTVANLKVRLLQLENLMALQGGELPGDTTFFTRSNKSSSSQNRKNNYEQNKEYIKNLKGRTRCYNCDELDHWTAECPHPRRDKDKHPQKNKGDRQQRIPRNKRSEACAATSDQPSSGEVHSASDSDHDSYLFMTTSRRSEALSVNLDKYAWYADSGATEHMIEHRDWFTNFKEIPSGTWSVAVADDRDLWVRGIGDINITRLVNGVQKKGVLQKVLYIPDLRRNLFSIGLASKAGLSFQTLGDKCVLYADLGRGPKVMEGNQIGTLYKLSINPVPPSQALDSTPVDHCPSAAYAATSSSDNDLILWHNRMGHVNIHTIKNMSSHQSVQGLPTLSNTRLHQVCRGCAFGKQHKATYPTNPEKERSKVPGELLHGDLCGKMSTPSLGGAEYYFLLKDDCTSFRFITFLKVKSDAIRFFYQGLTTY